MLTVDRLSKNLGGRAVLSGVSLTVRPGDKVAVLGPNGAGKSTLLKLVTGVWRPDTGLVCIDGASPRSKQGRLRLGAVFQEPTVDPFMNATETLRMHGILYGLRGRALASASARALTEVGLSTPDKENRRLSGGQLRRLELARCVLHNAALLVLDEPTSGLDPLARDELWRTVDRLRAERGLAVLFTTHHFEEITQCSQVYRLHDGGLEDCGAPDRDAFLATFARRGGDEADEHRGER